MPRGMKDLLGKVDRLDVDLFLLAVLAVVHARYHLVLGRTHTLSFERTLVGLQCNISLSITAIDVEVVVIRSRQDIANGVTSIKKKAS